MPLAEQIRQDMRTAWRAGDTARRDALRLLIAAIENARIDLGHEPTDEDVVRVLQKEAKQRRDSIEQFSAGGRADLADAEQAELDVISAYLPAELSDEELDAIVREAIRETGASGPGDLGKVMGPLMQRVGGRADGRRVNARVRELLTG